MISNNVKTKWAKKETVLNSFLSIANPFTAEIMSEQGYDALTIPALSELPTILSIALTVKFLCRDTSAMLSINCQNNMFRRRTPM